MFCCILLVVSFEFQSLAAGMWEQIPEAVMLFCTFVKVHENICDICCW